MLGKIEGGRRRGKQRMRWLDGVTGSVDMKLSKFWEIVEDSGAWRATVHEVEKIWTRLVTEQPPQHVGQGCRPRRQNLCLNAATSAKSLQSCPTLCEPRDSSPPGSPVPGILQARTLEWVAISFSNA